MAGNQEIMTNIQAVKTSSMEVTGLDNPELGRINSQDFAPYQPNEFDFSDVARIENIGRSSARIKVRSRILRESFIFIVASIIVVVNELFRDDSYPETDLSTTFGLTMAMVILSYFTHLSVILGGFRAVRNNKYLHRIYSLNTNKDNWANMTLTFGCISFKNYPIMSISELSAVHGGPANTMLTTFSCYCWCLGCCGIAVQQFLSDDDTRYWASDVFLTLLGGYGLTFVASFELDQLSDTMIKFHYLGAGLCVCTWLALILQSIKIYIATDGEYILGILLSIVFIIIVVTCFPLWLYFQSQGEKFGKNENECRSKLSDEEIAAKVTAFTLKCVGAEAAFLCALALSCATWLMQAGLCRENSCADVWF